MRKKLFTTMSLVVAFATLGIAPTASAIGDANNTTPASPGACNMVNASDNGLNGMMNDKHVWDIMIPLVLASELGGCTPANSR